MVGTRAATRCGRAPAAFGKSSYRASTPGTAYKYAVKSRFLGYSQMKSDPYGFLMETPPKSASIVVDMTYEWHDSEWMEQRASGKLLESAMSVYEVHVGSWVRGRAQPSAQLSASWPTSSSRMSRRWATRTSN